MNVRESTHHRLQVISQPEYEGWSGLQLPTLDMATDPTSGLGSLAPNELESLAPSPSEDLGIDGLDVSGVAV